MKDAHLLEFTIYIVFVNILYITISNKYFNNIVNDFDFIFLDNKIYAIEIQERKNPFNSFPLIITKISLTKQQILILPNRKYNIVFINFRF